MKQPTYLSIKEIQNGWVLRIEPNEGPTLEFFHDTEIEATIALIAYASEVLKELTEEMNNVNQ